MRQIALVFLTILLSCTSAQAEYGQVKSDGYRIPLGEAVQQISPAEWRVMFEDNTLRSYQVSWSKGKRWGEVLDEIGSQYDIAFLGDARNKTLYCANTKELVSRGFTLVGTDYEAEKYNLKNIAYRAMSETEAMADITARVRDAKTNLVDIEYSVNQKLRDYDNQKSQLLAAESTAIAMGLPSDKEFVSIVTDDFRVVPVKVIAVDPNDKYKLLNAGNLLKSANEYFSKRWKYNVFLRADSEDLKVSIPFTLKMPSDSLTNDIKSFSKSINTPENPVAVYFKVYQTQQYMSDGLGAIEVRYQRKNKDK